MRLVLYAAMLTVSLGCPASTPAVQDPSGSPGPGELDIEALVIPVGDRDVAADVLIELAERTRQSEVRAAWARAHYLLDLFDDARFARDDTSLAVLHDALGLPGEPARGGQATDVVLTGMGREVDQVLALRGDHEPARAAKALLAYDTRPPTRRGQVLRRMIALKNIVRSGGPLVANARLRLASYCARALADAVIPRYAERSGRVAHCLYPLYDADPEPYFAGRPSERPPPPDWRELAGDLGSLIDEVATSDSRVARAAAHQRRALAEFLAKRAPLLPSPPATKGIALPVLERAAPYDWTPAAVAPIEDAQADLEALGRAIAGDERGALAVVMDAGASGAELITAARLGVRVGAERLELVGAMQQSLTAPPGDYWHGRLRGGKASRLAIVPLSLAILSGRTASRSRYWDPDRATLGVHLIVTNTSWRLVAASGEIAVIAAEPASAEPARQLASRLRDLRAAFGGEDGLVIVPGPGATAGHLVRAAQASRRDAQGRIVMRQIALGDRAPAVVKKTLARRIARRKGAAVAVKPEVLSPRTSVLRACYQDQLERKPTLAGTFRLELRARSGKETVAVVSGPRDRALRACVQSGLSEIMKLRDVASAEVTLRVK